MAKRHTDRYNTGPTNDDEFFAADTDIPVSNNDTPADFSAETNKAPLPRLPAHLAVRAIGAMLLLSPLDM